MAYRFQFRGDKESAWKDKILADREIGVLINDKGKATNLYKIGDGATPWQDLPYFGFNGAISNSLEIQENEQADQTVLNKQVVIDKLTGVDSSITSITTRLSSTENEVINIQETIGTKGENGNIYKEIDDIKGTIGAAGDKDIYTEIGGIKEIIGTKGENNNIYTELVSVKNELLGRHNTVVLSTLEYDSMVSEDGSGLQENVLYFVYE